ncbi:MAG: hypothetical protein II467_05355 [Bacilli bacterium]|nr:hypothetical protein [Bacilli bacterium]
MAIIKKKKKYRSPATHRTSFRGKGEDYDKKERGSGLAASSTSYKDHYDAA